MAGLEDTQTGTPGKGLKPVSQLKTAGDLQKQFQTLARQRAMLEQNWKMCLAFYKGKQYVFYNRVSQRIEQMPVEDGDKPRYRVRIVSNQIMSGSHSLLSKYTKTKPVMHATPGTASDSDLKAAQVAEKLLDYWWTDLQLDDALEEVMLWTIICGNGYWEIRWDDHAGSSMSFPVDPQGNPIVDPAFQDLFKSQMAAVGMQVEEKTVYVGDVCVDVVSPFDLYLDPTVKKFNEAKYAFRVLYLSPDEVKARYNVDLPADAVNAAPDVTLPAGNAENRPEQNVRKVMCGYFVPQPTCPKGRVVIWTGDKILQDDTWDKHYPFPDLPIVKFPGLRVPGEIYDSSVVMHALPLQKELNRTLSQIVEYKNLTIKPRVWAPVGSLRQRLTTEPGAVYEFTPIGGLRPEIEQLPAMPPYVFEHLKEISARLADIFGNMEVMQGQVPPNVEAATAIDLLQEMASDRLAPTIKLMELALARAGRLMLALAKQRYIEPRMLKIQGVGGSSQVQQFKNTDIQGAVDVIVEAGSGLPRTRAGRQARVEWLIQNQIIPPQQAYKYLDLADMTGAQALMQIDEDQAMREVDKLNAGQPINLVQVHEAQEQAQQLWQEYMQTGVWDPDGQPNSGDEQQLPPDQVQQQLQQMIKSAGLQPNMADNHQVHLDVHARFIKSVEFEALAATQPDVAEDHITHWQNHIQIYFSMPIMAPPQAPRVTYQIKSTVGPTAGSAILQRSGVNVDPQTMAEPPLDTWVSDSVDDPNNETGPSSPYLAFQQMQQEQMQAQQQAAAQAQQQAQSAQMHHQQMGHQAEKHQMDMAQQHAKLLQMLEAAKPKPPAPKKPAQGGKK